MSSLELLVKEYSALEDREIAHLTRLVNAWGSLSDLSFSDLLLFVPVVGIEGTRFVVVGQARPTTSQTSHLDVLIGRLIDEAERPTVARTWRLQEMVDGDEQLMTTGESIRVQCIPVVCDDKVIAVLSRESALSFNRRPGQLERSYLDVFSRLAKMISRGEFPFDELIEDKTSPRIGDGCLIVNSERRIQFASPNAMNCMHRMGFLTNVLGARLVEVGIDDTVTDQMFDLGQPVVREFEPRLSVSLSIVGVPLKSDGVVDGALVLMRDVTDLRRLDRLLISKDATIREIHHRVKNNLQTISSLLGLQARRLRVGPARTALDEAHRRVRSIALVHEILSRDASEQLAFKELIDPLISVASETSHSEREIAFESEGDPGEVSAEIATPLAVVLAEILANAVEHAFVGWHEDDPDFVCCVGVAMANDRETVDIRVSDNGCGISDQVVAGKTKSLGLAIVRSLVETQLRGSIAFNSPHGGGTEVHIAVPLVDPDND